MNKCAAPRSRLPDFEVALAMGTDDIHAAQRLRYRVFSQGLGGCGDLTDHDALIEADRFDAYCDHLLLRDRSLPGGPRDQVIGTYRLLRADQALRAGQFYCEDEYDLGILRKSGRTLLELGRSCVDDRYRGGTALLYLWQGLARYVADHGAEVLFGVASFHGTDLTTFAGPLSLLHHQYRASANLSARSLRYEQMDILACDVVDRRSAMVQMPPLIKAYLRLGGRVGDGAFIDPEFNTTDVCMILDTAQLDPIKRSLYVPRPQ